MGKFEGREITTVCSNTMEPPVLERGLSEARI